LKVKRFACEFAYSELWSRQVLEYGYWTTETLAYLSNGLDYANVLIIGSMREVDPGNIHPGLDELGQHSRGV